MNIIQKKINKFLLLFKVYNLVEVDDDDDLILTIDNTNKLSYWHNVLSLTFVCVVLVLVLYFILFYFISEYEL